MTDPWPFDPNLKTWGATYTPATVTPGQEYWKLVQADGPQDIGGNHHVFVDVWDENGVRKVGVPVAFFHFKDGEPRTDRKKTEPKTGEPYAVDWPMYAGGNAYGVYVDDGEHVSETIFGFGLGSFVRHHSFRLIFRLTVAAQEPMPPPVVVPPDPSQPITQREYLEWAKWYIDKALEMT